MCDRVYCDNAHTHTHARRIRYVHSIFCKLQDKMHMKCMIILCICLCILCFLTPQRVPFGQHFWPHNNCLWHSSCILITKYYPFSRKLTLFFVTSLAPPFQGRFFLVYYESLCDILSPYCLQFKAHLLHIFRMSVEHLPNFLRIFLYIEMIFFFLHCALKPQAVCRHYFVFYFSKKSLISHAIYLFNNNKYIRSLLQSYITVDFGKKRKNETTNLELI